jgi:tripeptide aminopeptidase
MINQDRLIKTFVSLVRVDSETGQERAIADELIKRFSDLGLNVTEDDTKDKTGHGAGNLWIEVDGTGERRILFTSHMDTVTPGRSIQPQIQGEYIVSDGTTILGSDDKAGIAAILEGLETIKKNNLPHLPLQIVITVGEESGLVGAKAMEQSRLKADFGYAFDSNGPVGEIITAAPTQAKIQAVIRGKTAHAGVNPEDGISAIKVAAKAVSKMPLGRIDEETTANIGTFSGKGPTNIVNDYVEIIAEARSLSEEKVESQVKTMKATFEETAKSAGAKAEVHTEIMYPAYRLNEKDEVVTRAVAAVRKVGREPKLLSSGGGSDANIFNGLGVPTANLAIGYEHIHTKSERMPIKELVKAAELFVALSTDV